MFPPAMPILECPPFLINRSFGKYVHRPRWGSIRSSYDPKWKTSWSGQCWCGQGWSLKRHLFSDKVPDGLSVCATCEGRAIGAGQLESHMINGQMVKFSPRGS